jgi:hypothetical protein
MCVVCRHVVIFLTYLASSRRVVSGEILRRRQAHAPLPPSAATKFPPACMLETAMTVFDDYYRRKYFMAILLCVTLRIFKLAPRRDVS